MFLLDSQTTHQSQAQEPSQGLSFRADLFNFKIESTKNGTTYNNSSLARQMCISAKILGTTGWMDFPSVYIWRYSGNGFGVCRSELIRML